MGFRRSRVSDLEADPWRSMSSVKALSYFLRSRSLSRSFTLALGGLLRDFADLTGIPGSSPTVPIAVLRFTIVPTAVAVSSPAPPPITNELYGAGMKSSMYEHMEIAPTDDSRTLANA